METVPKRFGDGGKKGNKRRGRTNIRKRREPTGGLSSSMGPKGKRSVFERKNKKRDTNVGWTVIAIENVRNHYPIS